MDHTPCRSRPARQRDFSVFGGRVGIAMNYTLRRLAAGSYDLVLDGKVIGSVVEVALSGRRFGGWCAELLDDRPDTQRPAPFVAAEQTFASFAALRRWLGGAAIIHAKHDE